MSVRTCISCRCRSSIERLVRIYWSEEYGQLILGKGAGRGAWLHWNSECVGALKEASLQTALRVVAPIDQLHALAKHTVLQR